MIENRSGSTHSSLHQLRQNSLNAPQLVRGDLLLEPQRIVLSGKHDPDVAVTKSNCEVSFGLIRMRPRCSIRTGC
jgi:hypothetical protein